MARVLRALDRRDAAPAGSGATAVALATAIPEALVVGLDEDRGGEVAPSASERVLDLADGADAVLLGPGIGSPEAACALLTAYMQYRKRSRQCMNGCELMFSSSLVKSSPPLSAS